MLVSLVLAAHASGDEPVLAHGPCGCLTPASGPPGTTVSSAYPAYKVVFNPDRTDLSIGPESLWQEHRSGVAPAVVFRKTYRYSDLPLTGPVEFRVPTASPGRYLLSIYDGSERGAHYTWEYFRVSDAQAEAPASRPSAADPAVTDQSTGVSLLAAVIVGVAALLVGLLLGGLAAGRLRGSRSSSFKRPSA